MGKSRQVAGFQDLLNRTMLEQTLTLFHPRFLTKWEFRDTSIATYYPNFAPTSESRKSINFQCLLHFCEGICSKANCQWLSETEIDQKQYLGSKLFVARTSDWWTASRDTSLIGWISWNQLRRATKPSDVSPTLFWWRAQLSVTHHVVGGTGELLVTSTSIFVTSEVCRLTPSSEENFMFLNNTKMAAA